MKKNVSIILSIILTGLGGYLLSVNSTMLKVLGAIITCVGAYLTLRTSNQNASQDKNEIIEKIEEFKGKLDIIKLTTNDSDSRKRISIVENEFDDWAKKFSGNIENKRLEIKAVDIELEKRKIELSRKFRDMYVEFFNILEGLISAYNDNSSQKVKVVNRENIPPNLYTKETFTFYRKYRFSKDIIWYINIYPSEPLKEDAIPDILIHVLENRNEPLTLVFGDLSIRFNLQSTKLYISCEHYFRKLDVTSNFSINDYKSAFSEVLKQVFEYQIANL